MVATLVIEFSLAAYALWRYQMNVLARLITITLVCLGTFQLAEYFVCGGTQAEIWYRVGFAAITALPALGVHIMHRIAGRTEGKVVYAAYATMAGFIGFFMLYPAAFSGHQCTGNYVIFQLGNQTTFFYGLYYYGWLLTAMFLGLRWAGALADKSAKKAQRQATALRAMLIGYLVFLVPTASVYLLDNETINGIPSIMCGFAVIFALLLALYVLPRVAEVKEESTLKLDKAK